ncbi:flagellar biosynthetic protein FliO [Bacillus sp. CGMCC 1.16607]|uniref:flagellar biosynthetic protein FliO n=1 Tax=Bacillus sp. CGMCC 1.16607 TaxID=3351842 RepID=UPI00362AB4A1
MQIKTLFPKIIFVFIIALLGSQTAVYAEQVKNVKEWVENQDKENKVEPEKKTVPNQQKNVDKEVSNVGVTFFDFVKMIFALLFVIALLYAVLRFVNKKSKSFQSTMLVENLGGTSLGANRSVQLIKIGKQILVVGVGESIQLLKEIDDEVEYREIVESYNKKMDQMIQPSDLISRWMDKLNKWNKTTVKKEDKQFSSILRNQLNEFSNGRKKLLEEIEKEGSDER